MRQSLVDKLGALIGDPFMVEATARAVMALLAEQPTTHWCEIEESSDPQYSTCMFMNGNPYKRHEQCGDRYLVRLDEQD